MYQWIEYNEGGQRYWSWQPGEEHPSKRLVWIGRNSANRVDLYVRERSDQAWIQLVCTDVILNWSQADFEPYKKRCLTSLGIKSPEPFTGELEFSIDEF